jgi:hypothetical protein
MFTDDDGEFDLALCLCCEEKAAAHADRDLGGVCAECKAFLAVVHARLITTPGISACQEHARR